MAPAHVLSSASAAASATANTLRASSSSSSPLRGNGTRSHLKRATRRRINGYGNVRVRTTETKASLSFVDSIDLTDVTAFAANGAFLSLFVASSVYGTKAVFFPENTSVDAKKEEQEEKKMKTKNAFSVERSALQLSNVALILALSSRWAESGHFPLSNMYESLLFLAWGTTATAIYVNSDSKVFGALVSPVALFTVAGATLGLPKELQRASALVPALKSNWLMMHVSVMMMSYATLLAGSLACMGFLALEIGKENETVGKLTEKMEKAMFKDTENNVDNFNSNSSNEDEDEMLVMTTSRQRSNRPKIDAKTGEQVAYAMGSSTNSSGSSGSSSSSSSSSSSATATMNPRESPSSSSFPVGSRTQTELDNLSYRCLGLGFVLLTAGLISGAVWANEAWGSYWSWDPKETWALVTWFTYATYLHSRLVAEKPKDESAKIGAFGFIVVWICYVGVNLFGTGLHSYGWFASR